MIKDILVNLPVNTTHDAVAPFAATVAGTFGSQLTGVAFRYEPVIAPDVLNFPNAHFMDAQVAEAKKRAEAAVERLGFEIRRAQVPWTTKQIDSSADTAPGKFAEIARTFDLVIVGQADPDQPGVDDLIAEAALFESGRPILLVPYIQTKPFQADRVALCWDGGRPAARAVADALPLVKPGTEIKLVSITGDRKLPEEMAGVDMADHLARHGYSVERHYLATTADIASTILNFVAENDIDLLVMGGYGHSRVREFILGGATRGILGSMTVPALMSH